MRPLLHKIEIRCMQSWAGRRHLVNAHSSQDQPRGKAEGQSSQVEEPEFRLGPPASQNRIPFLAFPSKGGS